MAYHIIPSKVREVQDYLDIREINGYSIQYTPIHPADSSLQPLRCLVYIGMPDNPQFLGALHPQEVAERISWCKGPSGENQEYLFQLEESLKNLGQASGDEHVSDLVRRVKALALKPKDNLIADNSGLRKVGSTEEQEEIEKDL